MRKSTKHYTGMTLLIGLTFPLLMGCPYGFPPIPDPSGWPAPPLMTGTYQDGYDIGFADDDVYYIGYEDSFDTRDGGTIYYQGDTIPYIGDDSFESGYWDGLWDAYNDGYFTAYYDAFVVGFSEGYTAAFSPDWYDFLLNDVHVEWLDGGYSDGYNDGFSEGRIFGAADYFNNYTEDWETALTYYQEGGDEYIPSLDLGTGEYGPVILYEWGTDPNTLITTKSAKRRGGTPKMQIRNLDGAKSIAPYLRARPLNPEMKKRLDESPNLSPRGNRTLQLKTSRLERVESGRKYAP